MIDEPDVQGKKGSKGKEDTPAGPYVPPPLYIPVKWKGVLPTFQCSTCQHCDEDEDEMKLHVLIHAKPEDRNKLLDKLTRKDK